MNIIFWNLSGFGLKVSFYNQRLSSRVHNLTAGQGAFLSNIHVHRFPFHNGLFWFLTLLLAFALLVIYQHPSRRSQVMHRSLCSTSSCVCQARSQLRSKSEEEESLPASWLKNWVSVMADEDQPVVGKYNVFTAQNRVQYLLNCKESTY